MCRCHLILAGLRPAGQKGYVIPRGFLFDYITCPNYTSEILGWLCFSVATSTLPAALFSVAGTAQMWQWAAGKHARLRRVSHCCFASISQTFTPLRHVPWQVHWWATSIMCYGIQLCGCWEWPFGRMLGGVICGEEGLCGADFRWQGWAREVPQALGYAAPHLLGGGSRDVSCWCCRCRSQQE